MKRKSDAPAEPEVGRSRFPPTRPEGSPLATCLSEPGFDRGHPLRPTSLVKRGCERSLTVSQRGSSNSWRQAKIGDLAGLTTWVELPRTIHKVVVRLLPGAQSHGEPSRPEAARRVLSRRRSGQGRSPGRLRRSPSPRSKPRHEPLPPSLLRGERVPSLSRGSRILRRRSDFGGLSRPNLLTPGRAKAYRAYR
jgi:hypothetical protein